MKKVLTIAGSDCSGGAGIQADIKTIIMHKMYAMSAITSMTAQNTMGVFSVVESSPEFLSAQLDAEKAIFNYVKSLSFFKRILACIIGLDKLCYNYGEKKMD